MEILNILTICFAVFVVVTPIQCPTKCTCDQKNQTVSVNCSHVSSVPKFSDYQRKIHLLDLHNNSIANITANDIKPLTNLQTLILDDNKIDTLQNGTFSRNLNLQYLSITFNSLTQIEVGVFCNMDLLRSINLRGNKIRHIRANTFHNLSDLTYLDLSLNDLESIEENAFTDFPKLHFLKLQQNKLTSVPSHLFNFTPGLQYLHLEFNNITELKNFAFAPMVNLSSLYLSNNKFTVLEKFAFQYEENKEILIQHLEMSNCGLAEIPRVIDDLYSVTNLDLSLNNFTSISTAAFFNLENLEYLRLFKISALTTVSKDAFIGLSNLRNIHVSHCPNLRELPHKLFWKNTKLWGLYIGKNNLKSIPENLVRWDILKSMDIADNNLTCSCSIKWIKDKNDKQSWSTVEMVNNVDRLQCIDDKGNLYKVINFNFDSLNCQRNALPAHLHRALNAAVAAVIAVVIVLVFCVAFKYRRKILFKYREFKYSRYHDEAPYTIGTKYSDLSEAERSTTVNGNVYRDEKDNEHLI